MSQNEFRLVKCHQRTDIATTSADDATKLFQSFNITCYFVEKKGRGLIREKKKKNDFGIFLEQTKILIFLNYFFLEYFVLYLSFSIAEIDLVIYLFIYLPVIVLIYLGYKIIISIVF